MPKIIVNVNENEMYISYNNVNCTISYNRSMYVDVIISMIDRIIDITNLKPFIIKI